MQTWRLALHKSHNIVSTQTREPDAPVAEAVFQKGFDEWHVVDDHGAGQWGPRP